MFSIRETKEKDLLSLKELFEKHNLDLNSSMGGLTNSMVIIDGNEYIGFASYKTLDNSEAVINVLFIDEMRRKELLGDGLLKAILNLADKRGVTLMYAISNGETYGFFDKVGLKSTDYDIFKQVNKNFPFIDYDKEVKVVSAKLPDFFETACRSKR